MIYIKNRFPAWSEEDRAAIPIAVTDARVFAAANEVLDRFVTTLPVDPLRLARLYGVRVLPLSWYEDRGLPSAELFQVWGNVDGVASKQDNTYMINYNDRAPHHRARFTLTEELMHILLGHVNDPRFSVWSQDYSEDVYRAYENEAKTAAGLVLFPAGLWGRHQRASDRAVSKVCDISEACAYTTRKYYEEHEILVRAAATHKRLIYSQDALRSPIPYRGPISVWPSEQELTAMC